MKEKPTDGDCIRDQKKRKERRRDEKESKARQSNKNALSREKLGKGVILRLSFLAFDFGIPTNFHLLNLVSLFQQLFCFNFTSFHDQSTCLMLQTEESVSNTVETVNVELNVQLSVEPIDGTTVKKERREEAGLFNCNDCDLTYKYYTSYLKHVEREHPDKIVADDSDDNNDDDDNRFQDYITGDVPHAEDDSSQDTLINRRPGRKKSTIHFDDDDDDSDYNPDDIKGWKGDGQPLDYDSDWDPEFDPGIKRPKDPSSLELRKNTRTYKRNPQAKRKPGRPRTKKIKPRRKEAGRPRTNIAWRYFKKKSFEEALCVKCNRLIPYEGKLYYLKSHISYYHASDTPEDYPLGEDEAGKYEASDNEQCDRELVASSSQDDDAPGMYNTRKRPPKPMGRPRSSPIWQYFKQLSYEDCICLLCNQYASYMGNNSNMYYHIKTMHSEIHSQILEQLPKPKKNKEPKAIEGRKEGNKGDNSDNDSYKGESEDDPDFDPEDIKDVDYEGIKPRKHQRTGKKPPGRVWRYFTHDPEKSEDHVLCLKCQSRVLCKGSEFRLNRHLDLSHATDKPDDYPIKNRKDCQFTQNDCRNMKKNLKNLNTNGVDAALDEYNSDDELPLGKMRKPSYIWNYFKRLSPNRVECQECFKVMRYARFNSQTIFLKVHLEEKHFVMDPENPIPPSQRLPGYVRGRYKKEKTSKSPEGKVLEKYPLIIIADSCKKCGQEFDDDRKLVHHLRVDHFEKERGIVSVLSSRDPSLPRSKRPLVVNCDICYRKFLQDYRLAIHRKEEHDMETIIDDVLIEPLIPQDAHITEAPAKEKVPCEFCGELKVKAQLNDHIIRVHKRDELPYQCDWDGCDKKFVRPEILMWHRRDHREDISLFVCEHCGKKCNNVKAFRAHIKNEHSGVTHTCPDCGEQFKYRKNLNFHVQKEHIREMKHQCSFCGRKFWRADNMKSHIKSQHPDGVYDPVKFAENQRVDWIEVSKRNVGENRKPRQPKYVYDKMKEQKDQEKSDHSMSSASAATDWMGLQSSQKKSPEKTIAARKRKSTVSTASSSKKKTNKKSMTEEAASAVLQIEEIEDDSSSTYTASGGNVIDFSSVHDPLSTAVQVVNYHDQHYQQQYVSVPPIVQYQTIQTGNQRQSASHQHNTRYSSGHQQQPDYSSYTQVPVSTSCQYTISVQQQQMLTQLHSSAAALAAAHGQLQVLENVQLSAKCKLCHNHFNDIKKHITDFHRIPLDTALQLMGGSFT